MENREAIERALELLPQMRDSEWITALGQKTALYTDEAKEAFNMAISALEKQERDRWIPCNEKPPEKDGHYLVTLFDETGSWTEVLYWNTTFGGGWQGLIEDDFSDIGNVSAWRPLPEPYTEEEA